MDKRQKFRLGLSSLYLPYYDALCGLLGPEWQPYAGFRTADEQTGLYLKGRETPGPRITDAKSMESPHNYGCASDWCLWDAKGSPVWPPIGDLRWKEYADACEKVGLKWGGDWNRNGKWEDEAFKDFPHNELPITCSWKHVKLCFDRGGLTAAFQKIEVDRAV